MKLLKSLSLYVFASFFNKGLAILLLPVLTSYLSPADYGIANLFGVSVLLGQYLISFGTNSVLNVQYFKLPYSIFKQRFTAAIFNGSLVCILLFIPLLLFKEPLQAFTGINNFLLYTIPITAFSAYLMEIYLTLLRNEDKSFQYILISITSTVFELALVIGLVVFIGMHWEGRILSKVLGAVVVIFTLLIITRNRKLLAGFPTFSQVNNILVAGSPFILNGFTTYFLNNSNRYFIAYFFDNKEIIGLFSVSLSIGSLLLLLVNSMYAAVVPTIFSLLSHKEDKTKHINTIIILFVVVISLGAILIVLILPLLYRFLVNDSFTSSLKYVSYVLIAYVFWGISVLFREILIYYDRHKIVFLHSIITIVFIVLVNFLLTYLYEMVGILISFTVSYLFYMIINIIATLKVFNFSLVHVLSLRQLLHSIYLK